MTGSARGEGVGVEGGGREKKIPPKAPRLLIEAGRGGEAGQVVGLGWGGRAVAGLGVGSQGSWCACMCGVG